MAAAILDRLLHDPVINILGESCRLRDKRKAGTLSAKGGRSHDRRLDNLLGRVGGLQRVALAWLVADSVTALAWTPHLVRVYRAGRAAGA